MEKEDERGQSYDLFQDFTIRSEYLLFIHSSDTPSMIIVMCCVNTRIS